MLAHDRNVISMLDFAQLDLSKDSKERAKQLAIYFQTQENTIRSDASTRPSFSDIEITHLLDPESKWLNSCAFGLLEMLEDQLKMKRIVESSYYTGVIKADQIHWLQKRQHKLHESGLRESTPEKLPLTFYIGPVPRVGPLTDLPTLDFSTLSSDEDIQLDEYSIAIRRMGNALFYGVRLYTWATHIFDGLYWFLCKYRTPDWIRSCRSEECKTIFLDCHPTTGGIDRVFCSTRCRNKYHQTSKRQSIEEEVKCLYVNCDQKFVPKSRRGRKKKYCSSKCRIYDYRLRVKES